MMTLQAATSIVAKFEHVTNPPDIYHEAEGFLKGWGQARALCTGCFICREASTFTAEEFDQAKEKVIQQHNATRPSPMASDAPEPGAEA